jgi:hypothetical protein
MTGGWWERESREQGKKIKKLKEDEKRLGKVRSEEPVRRPKQPVAD